MNQQPNRRSELLTIEELRHFTIQAINGELGYIADLIIEPTALLIRYLVVETGNRLSKKKVIIPVGWIDEVAWQQQLVRVSVTREQVENSPPLESIDQLDRAFEERFYGHYQRPPYWIKDSTVDEASWESFPASDPPATW